VKEKPSNLGIKPLLKTAKKETVCGPTSVKLKRSGFIVNNAAYQSRVINE
jgi:hypothetical protein